MGEILSMLTGRVVTPEKSMDDAGVLEERRFETIKNSAKRETEAALYASVAEGIVKKVKEELIKHLGEALQDCQMSVTITSPLGAKANYSDEGLDAEKRRIQSGNNYAKYIINETIKRIRKEASGTEIIELEIYIEALDPHSGESTESFSQTVIDRNPFE